MKKLNRRQKIIIFTAILLIIIILSIIIMNQIIKSNNIESESYEATITNATSNLVASYIKKGVKIGGVTGTLEVIDTLDANATSNDILWGKTGYVKGVKVEGTRVYPKIGGYVDYTPDIVNSYALSSSISGYSSDQTITQNTSLKWRIFSINIDGSINLISDVQTNNGVWLGGALGYNNGVYLLNDICKSLYSNSSLGATARSIKLEDVEAKMNETGIKLKNEYTQTGPNDAGLKYGESKTYTDISYDYYPNIYINENGSGVNSTKVKIDGVGQSDSYYTSPTTETFSQAGDSGLTATLTFYKIEKSNIKLYFNDINYELLFPTINTNINENYWVATRSVSTYGNYVAFELRTIGTYGDYSIDATDLKGSDFNFGNRFTRRLRPIVTLSANTVLSGGDGSEEHPYQLSV